MENQSYNTLTTETSRLQYGNVVFEVNKGHFEKSAVGKLHFERAKTELKFRNRVYLSNKNPKPVEDKGIL